MISKIKEMKIKAIKTTGGELKAGDLFSTADQNYWDNIKRNQSIGERVYIRTEEPCPVGQEDEEIYKIIIE